MERQPANRYFKRTKLTDIIMTHGKLSRGDDKHHLAVFCDFLLGILDPDPWKRWTAFQAAQHPFLTGRKSRRQRPESEHTEAPPRTITSKANDNMTGINWVPPWDPSICRRKLLTVQKTRERQQALQRGYGATRQQQQQQSYETSGVEVDLYERMRQNSDSANLGWDGKGYVDMVLFGSLVCHAFLTGIRLFLVIVVV